MGHSVEFGDLLASLVRRRGLTMGAFAAQVGLSASTLSRVRTGRQAPDEAQSERWGDALGLTGEERADFIDRAITAGMPKSVRDRLLAAEERASSAHDHRARLENDFGRYRGATGFHDGWWLTYSRSFYNDGAIQRSLLRIAGDQVAMEVRDAGMLHYSYHGGCEILGEKLFIRASEDRGGTEWVQITLNSLFDWSRPTFLYGLVCGISGKGVQHPVSWPVAARIVLLHVGGLAEIPEGSPPHTRLGAILGSFDPAHLRGVWPSFLGDDDHLRAALHLEDGSLDAAILGMTDNGLGGNHVLRAVLSS
ncbi:MAG: helix-turn-helix domain-containing protein [Planctomycetes bacterium]|nr:helix-turn-helix domain-containing protein [Planctomycetota bacterium]